MKVKTGASILVSAAAFVFGSFFIFEGATAYLGGFLTDTFCFGYECPQFSGSILFDLLGLLLVYLSLPVALLGIEENRIPKWFQTLETGSDAVSDNGSESSLLGNKRISGLALIIAGSVQLIFAFLGFYIVPLFYLSGGLPTSTLYL